MESLFRLTELEARIPLNLNVLVGGLVPKVIGLAEFMNFPGVLAADPGVLVLSRFAGAAQQMGEALTNIAATQIGALNRVKLSANWMAAALS